MNITEGFIQGNTAVSFGGGVSNDTGTVILLDSEVTGNAVTASDGQGGGAYSRSGTVARRGSTDVSGNTPDQCNGCAPLGA